MLITGSLRTADANAISTILAGSQPSELILRAQSFPSAIAFAPACTGQSTQ